jgi:outer membrane protein TolC
MLINEGTTLKDQEKVTESMLNTILGRPHDERLGKIPDLENGLSEPGKDKNLEDAMKQRPELLAMDENIRMKDAELDLAKREYYPDIMLRLMYKDMKNGPDNYFSTMVAVDIPFFFLSGGKVKGRVEESRLNVLKAKEDYRNMKNMTLFQVREATVNVETSRKNMVFFKTTVIPQAEQTRESMTAAYVTGTAELFSLIESLRMELGVRENYYGSVADYLKSMAALDQAMGRCQSGSNDSKDAKEKSAL